MAGRSKADLRGDVVAVTGGARGIGLGIARACADAGMRVAIGDLAEGPREDALAEINGEAIAVPLNVTSRESFAGFLDRVERDLGPLDVLVNNAGVFAAGPFHEEPDETTDLLVDVNVRGVATGTKLAIARMLPRGRGHIVNLASIGAVIPTTGAVTYSMSKAAVLALCRAARWELTGTGIRVTAILPGTIRTEMTAPMAPPPRGTPQPLDPYVVGEKVVKALRTGAPELFVPGALTPVNRMLGLLGPRSGDALKRRTGIDKLVSDRDLEAEARYRSRVLEEKDGAR